MSEATSKLPRLLLLAALLLFILTAFLLLGSYVLLSSQAGTRWLAGQIQSRLGDTVAWESLEGSLAGPLVLTDVQVTQPGKELRAERVTLDWQPGALLGGRLSVDQLALKGVRVDLSETAQDADTSPFRPSQLELPVNLNIAMASLEQLQVFQAGELTAEIERLSLQATLADGAVDLGSLELKLPGASVIATGTTTLADQMPLALEVDWAYELPVDSGVAPLAGSASLSGDLDWGDQLAFALDYSLSAGGLEQVLAELPGTLSARGQIRGSQSPEALALEQLSLGFEELPAQVNIDGTVQGLDQAQPELAVRAAWRELQWPLIADTPQAASEAGELQVTGRPESYQLSVEATLSGGDIPPGRWRVAGEGDTEGLQLESATAQLLDGELSASGHVAWAPEPAWDLSILGTELDPEPVIDTVTGVLTVDLETRGSLAGGENLQADVELRQLSGVLMDYPLEARGSIQMANDNITIRQLQANSGANRLTASGTLEGDELALTWDLRAADPGVFMVGARGLLTGEGSASGPLEQLQVEARIASSQLQLEDIRIEDLSLYVAAGMAHTAPLAIELSARSPANAEDAAPTVVSLSLEGTNREHQAELRALQGKQQLSAALAGGLDEQLAAWRGTLDALTLDTDDFGRWRLQEAAGIAASAESASLGRACVARVSRRNQSDSDSPARRGSACTELAWEGDGDSSVRLTLSDLPMRLLVRDITSRIDGTLDARMTAAGELRAKGELNFSGGEVKLDTGNTRTLAHGGGALSLVIDDQGLRGNLGVDAPEQGRIDAQVALPAMHTLPLPEVQPLRGTVRASLPDLSGMANWFEELEASQGSMDLDFTLGGTLQQPRLEGALALRDGGADIPVAGLQLEQVNLEARSDPQSPERMVITGRAHSGPGSLAITGEANLDALTLQLDIDGERFLVYDTVDARALVSPDLQVEWQDQLVRLRGQLEIPEASLTPQLQLGPGAASPSNQAVEPGSVIARSPDVVVLHGPQAEKVEALPIKIDSEIEIVLGHDVDVNALGFISRLPGAITLSHNPDQGGLVPTASGRLAIEDGTFRAFGQDLEIESGQIIFPGGPATEPELNLRAVRWIDNDPEVTAAGVIVTGPATAPTLTLFSRPQKDPAVIQSYLLTGRSPNNRDTVLSIGTYVTPRVYVGYGYNLLQGTNEFNSLFSVTPRIGVGGNFGEADNNVNMTVTYER